MLTLYPPIQPYHTLQLAVDAKHTLYVEESGNPKGTPVLVVHGGPGAGCHEDQRRFFNPDRYRIILFDQRGCGQSTPHLELKTNNTQALVEDMEAIRRHLHIEGWLLFGGSWGSTLSLVYAETHPNRVTGMILRGIFLNRNEDIEWYVGSKGACQVFPDYWQEFIAPIPKDHRHNILQSYYSLLTGENEIARMGAAKAWSSWEARLCSLHNNPGLVSAMTHPSVAVSLALFEVHYMLNNCFLEPNQILNNIEKIANIPGTIVHGRYDMVCNMSNAFALHQAWPNAKLQIIPDAGHAASEPGITDALIHATLSMISPI